MIRENPYIFGETRGIGSLASDTIARSMGLNPLPPEHAATGLPYLLKEAETLGYLCILD